MKILLPDKQVVALTIRKSSTAEEVYNKLVEKINLSKSSSEYFYLFEISEYNFGKETNARGPLLFSQEIHKFSFQNSKLKIFFFEKEKANKRIWNEVCILTSRYKLGKKAIRVLGKNYFLQFFMEKMHLREGTPVAQLSIHWSEFFINLFSSRRLVWRNFDFWYQKCIKFYSTLFAAKFRNSTKLAPCKNPSRVDCRKFQVN